MPRNCFPRLDVTIGVLIALAIFSQDASAQHPPNPPVITSPSPVDSISAFDVHMETGPMTSPDTGKSLASADWQIVLMPSGTLVWFENNSTSLHAVHTHFTDGAFTGPYAGRTSLDFSTQYKVRVRHKDSANLFSNWSEQLFVTGRAETISPLALDSAPSGSAWSWEDSVTGAPLYLPDGPDPGRLQLYGVHGGPLLTITGTGGVSDSSTSYPSMGAHFPVMIKLFGATGAMHFPASRLRLSLSSDTPTSIRLPAIDIAVGDTARFWVSSEGTTWAASPSDTGPTFQTALGFNPIPYAVRQNGYMIEKVAEGLQLPMGLAFAPNPGPNPGDPYLYIAQLYGTIKLLHRDGSVTVYASNLLNFNPTGYFPGSGEQGIGNICVDPISGDLFCTLLYDSAPPNGPHYPRILRLSSADGGQTASSVTTVMSMPGETMVESHFISSVTVGPDSKLYVHLGDGLDSDRPLDMNSFRGKIIRLNFDGSPCTDNPFYNAGDGINAKDYIFAYGFRNPFGGTWRLSDGAHYEVENGTNVNDRFARVDRGVSYGWNGYLDSLTHHAIYNWTPTHAPVNVTSVEFAKFGGSGFPSSKFNHLFVTESGPTFATGAQTRGKRIVEFDVDPNGQLVSGPSTLVEYNGYGQASAAGLAAGPDGLYFTDLYKDHGLLSPIDPGACLYRIRYIGTAPQFVEFAPTRAVGASPLSTLFIDQNGSTPGITRTWNFGDGGQSTQLNPLHAYAQPGLYDVSLNLSGPNGGNTRVRGNSVMVGGTRRGLKAEYFSGLHFNSGAFTRTEPGVRTDWYSYSPGGGLGVDSFSVRWSGYVVPKYSENYTFHLTSDDGARLWVNNQLIVDHFVDQGYTDWTGNISLQAGQAYPIRVDYFEEYGNAACELRWQSASQALEEVPGYRLFWVDSSLIVGSPPPLRIASPLLRSRSGNPARGSVSLEFALPETQAATLKIYDVQGRTVAHLFSGTLRGGEVRRATLDNSTLSSGVYFARLAWQNQSKVTRLVFLR